METRKVHADGNKHCPGKNGDYMLSSLDSRSISVSRQAVSEMKIFAIRQLQFIEF